MAMLSQVLLSSVNTTFSCLNVGLQPRKWLRRAAGVDRGFHFRSLILIYLYEFSGSLADPDVNGISMGMRKPKGSQGTHVHPKIMAKFVYPLVTCPHLGRPVVTFRERAGT